MSQTRRTERPSERAMREVAEEQSAALVLDRLRAGDKLAEAIRRVRQDYSPRTQYEAEEWLARRLLETNPGVTNRDAQG